ncbi:MAG: hypothetical protein QOK23_3165 [Gammaproteobacteria bacterium]|jgi:hypothetical protein|nr:hypothetical protein [Gammaproteobacteria bacterium]
MLPSDDPIRVVSTICEQHRLRKHAPGIRMDNGFGYTNNPTPVIYGSQTGLPSIYPRTGKAY